MCLILSSYYLVHNNLHFTYFLLIRFIYLYLFFVQSKRDDRKVHPYLITFVPKVKALL